ncbi:MULTISPECIES: hypothetical protein [Bacillota]|uniref:Uncharacterized protein n=1 Tax=Anaerococcus degeneri TaxID=361500 RepID=A0ABS7YWS9_9FIRM|nr:MULTISPECIES: hypothetical protein [Bacillota]HEL0650337.1 hypothetical protein [Streptococcus equi subsp. zooepidemicus]MBP2015802.1 hypothetical protein [Anaerococcus degeneri]MCA2095554.1 hypothetical protein [Anaerococcus degeneri]MCW1049827.1 hypothetical protein [Streptococcus anginosus]MDK6672934.1 hypothetical protein [Streptococcus agalactiae]
MAKKFLTKEGLDRFFAKLKGKFAPIDSPAFKGNPTVETPDYEPNSKGKEVINREYFARANRSIFEEFELKITPVVLIFSIKPNEWKLEDGIYYYDKIKEHLQLQEIEDHISIASFIKIDDEKGSDVIRELGLVFRLEIDEKMRIRFYGDKPEMEIPVIVTAIRAVDLSMILGGM